MHQNVRQQTKRRDIDLARDAAANDELNAQADAMKKDWEASEFARLNPEYIDQAS